MSWNEGFVVLFCPDISTDICPYLSSQLIFAQQTGRHLRCMRPAMSSAREAFVCHRRASVDSESWAVPPPPETTARDHRQRGSSRCHFTPSPAASSPPARPVARFGPSRRQGTIAIGTIAIITVGLSYSGELASPKAP
ncbi:hypothetical protein GGTG_10492 [Gaeumannomyces tritici R3-111a-1]|uniref:Uncharacterized protein n=1 Tax=Gaeumannomyces tritici (strain R3-111a-1) TaxID=644352 RepID=J3PAG6_GAET3|nr:hypothetical protein GGTG_10492 [Gaeumannomyces tritici R3-111a-1]EJT71232.1 hypothetical protein GGTG_10492 [Gaeumannomyces tritici R3-111a-1]